MLGGAAAGLAVLALLAASGGLTAFWTSTFYAGAAPQRLQALQSLEPLRERAIVLAGLRRNQRQVTTSAE